MSPRFGNRSSNLIGQASTHRVQSCISACRSRVTTAWPFCVILVLCTCIVTHVSIHHSQPSMPTSTTGLLLLCLWPCTSAGDFHAAPLLQKQTPAPPHPPLCWRRRSLRGCGEQKRRVCVPPRKGREKDIVEVCGAWKHCWFCLFEKRRRNSPLVVWPDASRHL